MKPSNLFNSDDRAVSPVIGVILMVAITVILAAVIGTFVLGLGDSLGDSQPTAQLSVDVTTNDTGDTGTITIEHGGGDPIDSGALQVSVSGNGTSEATNQFDDRFTVGDIYEADFDGSTTGVDVNANDEIRVRIIHSESESILLDRTIEVNNGVSHGETLTFNPV
ncbi:type IV pilin N-terminal domain-containing protein [Halorubrum sp. Boch-26]|uniref:type IV pilin N-terminal domain-containing protein n=1 Tax=Halorubrum sp. Boch-26 TaxID=2994426 RepID=UPI002469B97C|nr:type IV pilin N-terminal domain-containing protein [Halorubrum sp. Boch-26]